MPFEVTAPYGRTPYHTWWCVTCTDGEPATDVGSREQAAKHVAETGHTVVWVHGTSELLTGLATTPQAGPLRELR